MDQLGPQGLWTNMVVQRPVMETNNLRYPTAAVSVQPDDLSPRVTPSPRHLSPDYSLLDGEKTGATLLFTGVFLAIVGVIFTTIGWHNYLSNHTFEWTQLLGPILISVGGTFMLTSVCKFGIISCWPCRMPDDEAIVIPAMEQNSGQHSFTLNGINHPTMLQNSTAMLCLPPVYDFITGQAGTQWPGGSVNDIRAGIPPHVYCVDNAAFTAEEEDSSVHSSETYCRRSRTEKTEDDRGRDDDSSSTCSRPPAYEDIYPSFTKPNLT